MLDKSNIYCYNAIYKKKGVLFLGLGIVIFFVNSVVNYFMYSVEYASDTEWSRYVTLTIIYCLFIIILNSYEYFYVRIVISIYNNNYYFSLFKV